MKRPGSFHAVELLEHAANARLAAAHAQLLSLRAQRTGLVTRTALAKRSLHAHRRWTAFDCITAFHHTLWSAVAGSELSERQRETLAAGIRFAKEKARWAGARRGLLRRATRAPESKRWPD